MNNYSSINPRTHQLAYQFPLISDEELQEKVGHNYKAFYGWRELSLEDRVEKVRRLATTIESDITPYVNMIKAEVGKIETEAIGEVKKCIEVIHFYCDNAQDFLKPEVITTPGNDVEVHYEAQGAILAIMPWNFPMWQVFRFLPANLILGNSILLKHAPETCGMASLIEKLMTEAGLPEHLVSNLYTSNEQTQSLIANPLVRAVTFTGSTETGKLVAQTAGANLKKCVLELGGSDAFLVFDDCDLKTTVSEAIKSRLLNAGQSCIAAKRFIIHQNIYDEFKKELLEQLDKVTELAPLITIPQTNLLEDLVEKSLKAGAVKIYESKKASEEFRNFYPIQVLENVEAENPLFKEESFGPVFSLTSARDTIEMLSLANDSHFGLSSAVFTSDSKKAKAVAHKLDAGASFINRFSASSCYYPFGGVKESGFGRELGKYGIIEFANIKSISL